MVSWCLDVLRCLFVLSRRFSSVDSDVFVSAYTVIYLNLLCFVVSSVISFFFFFLFFIFFFFFKQKTAYEI